MEDNQLDIHDRDAAGMVPVKAPTIASIIATAVQDGKDPAYLKDLVGLYERLENRKAEQDFHRAMSEFKKTCPPTPRRSVNSQFMVVRDGVKVPRHYASLEDIQANIGPHLNAVGLHYRWGDSSVSPDGKMMYLPCVIAHDNGHSVSSTAPVPLTSSAGCSDAQKFGAALRYGQRFSLIQALGLTDCDEDAIDPPGGDAAEFVTPEQAANLEAAVLGLTGGSRMVRPFLQIFKAGTFADIPAARYSEALAKIAAKRKEQA